MQILKPKVTSEINVEIHDITDLSYEVCVISNASVVESSSIGTRREIRSAICNHASSLGTRDRIILAAPE